MSETTTNQYFISNAIFVCRICEVMIHQKLMININDVYKISINHAPILKLHK